MTDRETIYIKRGKRYKPIYEYDPMVCDSFPEGAHLVVSVPGHRLTRFRIDPNNAPVLAAVAQYRDKLIEAVTQAVKMKPRKDYDTPKHKRAWKAYCDAMGDENAIMYLDGPSIVDIVEALEKAVLEVTRND